MARFRATIKGQRGEASRLGGPKQGIVAVANGWDVGVRVVGGVTAQGDDEFQVYATGGSNGGGGNFVGVVRLTPNGNPVFVKAKAWQ